MNKRIKLKKGILHKKCDEKCVNYRIIREEKLFTNNICESCKHKDCDTIQDLLLQSLIYYIYK